MLSMIWALAAAGNVNKEGTGFSLEAEGGSWIEASRSSFFAGDKAAEVLCIGRPAWLDVQGDGGR